MGVTHLLDILVFWRHCLALVTASAPIVYPGFDERRNGLLIGLMAIIVKWPAPTSLDVLMTREQYLAQAASLRHTGHEDLTRANESLYASCARDMSKATAGSGGRNSAMKFIRPAFLVVRQ